MKSSYALLLALSLAAWVAVALLARARARRIDRLLSEPDDSKLCLGVFERLRETRDESVSAAAWPEHERVVALAIETSAIIGNGGFSFLFGSELAVDPTYLLSLRALDAVKAEAAARAYRDALELFPKGSVPADLEHRRRAIEELDEAQLAEIDRRFLYAQDELYGDVAAYIRAHRAAFEAAWKG
ncbi:MAG: DUF4375 domain-containing protein [Myxococcales bacterium]|nr:MAG: DUF4375 domain-containing protein [Myxococcales bacterium]